MTTDALRGAPEATEGAPKAELLTGVVGDRCPNCKAAMAADQRYCLSCGERRGRARFSPDTFLLPTATDPAAAPPPLARRLRFSAGTTIVAGVATLLLAMGVGVLIGAVGNNSSARTPPPQIVTVGGGGTPTHTAAATTGTHRRKAASAKPARKPKRTVVHVTAKTAKAATAAASKVLGSSKNLSNNVQQSIGGSCSGGAGCENHKFTGNFFPNG